MVPIGSNTMFLRKKGVKDYCHIQQLVENR